MSIGTEYGKVRVRWILVIFKVGGGGGEGC